MIVCDLSKHVPVGKIARTKMASWGSEFYPVVRAWKSFPGIYGFHESVLLHIDLVVLLEHRDTFWKVLAGDREVWIDNYKLDLIE